MTPQGVVEITLHFHFKALLSAMEVLHASQFEKPTERGGEHYPVLVFWSASEVFGEMGDSEQKALVHEKSSSARQCPKPNGEHACSASEQI